MLGYLCVELNDKGEEEYGTPWSEITSTSIFHKGDVIIAQNKEFLVKREIGLVSVLTH